MRGTIRKHGRRLAVSVVMAAMLVGGAPEVRANGNNKVLSKKSFVRAELLYRQANFRQALAAYNKAMSYYRHPAYLFNIAQCHRNLKEYTKARFFYKLYLSEAGDATNRAEVERLVAAMELKIADEKRRDRLKGKLSVVSDPSGAEVYINDVKGKPLGRTPTVLRLPPGQLVVVIRYAGFVTMQRAVTIKPGAVEILKVVLKRDVPRRRLGSGAGERVVPGKPYHQRWWFWTGLSVALAAVGAATYTGTQALLIQKKWDDNRGAPVDDPNLKKRGETFRTVTDVLIGVAALSAGAAIIGAIIVSRRSRKDRRQSTVVVPSCGPSGCGVWVTGRF